MIGFMASGKSLISRSLAKKMNRNVVSTDQLIEQREGCSIKEIFAQQGEAYFRRVEADVVAELAQREGIIIDCGGGVILNPDNVAHLKHNGVLVHLNIDPHIVADRVKASDKRPLLNVDDVLETVVRMMDERAPYYAQADISVDVSGLEPDEAADQIQERMQNV